jgi:hypothetical protein
MNRRIRCEEFSVVSLKFFEEQMQVFRLHLPHKARQILLRMTGHHDANFRLSTPGVPGA